MIDVTDNIIDKVMIKYGPNKNAYEAAFPFAWSLFL